MDELAEREHDEFCSICGVSLVRLEGSHISSDCDRCGKRKYFVRLGEGGKGLKVEKGESISVRIPPFSLKPGPSKFFKPGLSWFLRMLFFPPALRPVSTSAEEIIKSLEEHFNQVHRDSRVLADLGIDFDNPPEGYDFGTYFEAIKTDEASKELWAFNGLLHLGKAQEELKNGNAEATFVSIHSATRCAAVVTLFGDIEETVWRGYQWNLKIFEVSGVQVGDPMKVEALEALAEKLASISHVALHDFLQSEDVKSKLDTPHLTNDEIKSVVQYVWDSKKELKEDMKEERQFRLDKYTIWTGLLSGVIGAVIGALLGR